MTLTAVNEFLNLPATGPLTDEQRALFAVVEALPELRPLPPRDGNGRYRFPDPVTGETVSTTRATTFASALDGGHMLEAWSMRMTAIGVAGAPDLAARIATAAAELDRAADKEAAGAAKRALNGLAERAKTLSGADTNREVGTALHAVAERLDHGIDVQVPKVYAADLAAREAALSSAGLSRPAVYRERVVTLPDLGVTGTTDGIAVDPSGALFIFDDKFGESMDYAWAKTLVQLALYANAPWMWDHNTSTWVPMPAVSRTTAYICHTPAGTGTSTVYELDLVEGWELAQLCEEARSHTARASATTRQAAKGAAFVKAVAHSGAAAAQLEATVDLLQTSGAPAPVQEGAVHPAPSVDADGLTGPVGQEETGTTCPASSGDETDGAAAPPAAAVPSVSPHAGGPAPMDDSAQRTAWINQRMAAIKATGNELAMQAAAKYWPADTPYPPGPWTDEQVHAIDAVLCEIERLDGLPFAPPAPGAKEAAMAALPELAPEPAVPPAPDDTSRPTAEALAALLAVATSPDVAARGIVITQWRQQAITAGAKWDHGKDTMSARHCQIQLAVVECALSLLDGNDTDDSLVRCALAEVLGLDEDASPSETTGHLLGALTIEQADRLSTLAAGFGAGDDEAVAVLAARLNRQFAQAS